MIILKLFHYIYNLYIRNLIKRIIIITLWIKKEIRLPQSIFLFIVIVSENCIDCIYTNTDDDDENESFETWHLSSLMAYHLSLISLFLYSHYLVIIRDCVMTSQGRCRRKVSISHRNCNVNEFNLFCDRVMNKCVSSSSVQNEIAKIIPLLTFTMDDIDLIEFWT